MRWIALLCFGLLAGSCSEDEETGFTSLIGAWKYETPDKKIIVEFDIAGGSTTILAIENPKIFVDGTEGKAFVQAEDITETTMSKLRINANDAALTYPFDIVFNELTASTDFKTINVKSATYIWPWSPSAGPTSNSLSEIQIVRR